MNNLFVLLVFLTLMLADVSVIEMLGASVAFGQASKDKIMGKDFNNPPVSVGSYSTTK
jgi:hypothetical protein